MTVAPRPRHVTRIARVELRRSLRKLGANGSTVALVALNVLLFGVFTLAGAGLAWAGGRALARGVDPPLPVVPTARGVVGLAALSVAGFTLARVAGQGADLDSPEGLLSTVPVADAVAGVLLAEAGRALLLVGPPLVLIGGTFAVAAGAPSMAVTLPLATVGLLTATLPVGFAVGFGVRYVLTRYDPIAGHRTLIGATALVVWMVVALSGRLNDVGRALFDPLAATPLGWFADLLFLGVPGLGADPLRAVGAVPVAVALAAPAVAAAVRLSEAVWLSDPPSPDDDENGTGGWLSVGGDRTPFARPTVRSAVGRRTSAVATAVWLRARRAPIELTYVLYPVFFGVYVFQDVFQRGSVPAYVPSTVLLYAAWAVGAAFTLNPLGSQGPTLPATLSSRIDGRAYLRGHLVVAAVVGAPVATLLTVGTAVASPLGAAEVGLLAAVTPACSVGAAALATGFGVAFPRFGTVSVTSNREAVIPSKSAAATYSLVLLVLLSLAVVGLEPTVRGAVVDALGVPAPALVVGAVVPLAACASLSYRYAAGRIGDYRLD